jgi:hypothetical protein
MSLRSITDPGPQNPAIPDGLCTEPHLLQKRRPTLLARADEVIE